MSAPSGTRAISRCSAALTVSTLYAVRIRSSLPRKRPHPHPGGHPKPCPPKPQPPTANPPHRGRPHPTTRAARAVRAGNKRGRRRSRGRTAPSHPSAITTAEATPASWLNETCQDRTPNSAARAATVPLTRNRGRPLSSTYTSASVQCSPPAPPTPSPPPPSPQTAQRETRPPAAPHSATATHCPGTAAEPSPAYAPTTPRTGRSRPHRYQPR